MASVRAFFDSYVHMLQLSNLRILIGSLTLLQDCVLTASQVVIDSIGGLLP